MSVWAPEPKRRPEAVSWQTALALVGATTTVVGAVFAVHSWGVNTSLEILKETVSERVSLADERLEQATALVRGAAHRDSVSRAGRDSLLAVVNSLAKQRALDSLTLVRYADRLASLGRSLDPDEADRIYRGVRLYPPRERGVYTGAESDKGQGGLPHR